MYQCRSCSSLITGLEALPHLDGSATVQCLLCHDRGVQEAAYRLAVARIAQALEPAGPTGQRTLALRGHLVDLGACAQVLAAAFGRPSEEARRDVEAAFDPTCARPEASPTFEDAIRILGEKAQEHGEARDEHGMQAVIGAQVALRAFLIRQQRAARASAVVPQSDDLVGYPTTQP